jgi:hypothetical protein
VARRCAPLSPAAGPAHIRSGAQVRHM